MQKEEYLFYIKLNTMLYINTLLYIKYPVIF